MGKVLPFDREEAAMARLAELVGAMPPAQLAEFARQLSEPDQAVLEYVMAEHHAAGWRSDPAVFMHHLDPTLVVYPYVQLWADKFKAAVDGTSPRQLWAAPGRYGKTSLLNYGIAWALDLHPAARSMFISYGDSLALESGTRIRDILEQHGDELRVRLRRDRRKADRWWTDEGGGLLAGGIRTGITGYGVSAGGVLVVDDPLKGWQEAHRKTERDDAYQRLKGTLRNRLDDEGAGIIVVHHRLHQDDPIGRLLQEAEDGTGDPWEYVCLPAIAPDPAAALAQGRTPPPDALGRRPGEVIEPARYDLAAVQSRHRGMGSSYLVAALEQQDPQPPEGKELLREWFVLYEAAEAPRAPETAISSWDLKLKDKEAGDYVVGQVWWRVGGAYFLVDQIRGQYDHGTTANAMALLAVRNPETRTHWVEAAGSANEVLPELRKAQPGYEISDAMAERLGMNPVEREAVQELRRGGMPGLQKNPAKGDKSVRARAYIATNAEPGHVRLPADATWVPALLDEIAEFPGGLNDDQVDAMSQGLQKLARGGATASAAKGSIQPPTPAQPTPPAAAGRRATAAAPRGRIPRRLG